MIKIVSDPFWNRVIHAVSHTITFLLSGYLLCKEWARNAFGKGWMSLGLSWDPSKKDQLDKAIRATERGVANTPSHWSWEHDPGVQEAVECIRSAYKPAEATIGPVVPKITPDTISTLQGGLFWRGVQLIGVPSILAGFCLRSAKAACNDWHKVIYGEKLYLVTDTATSSGDLSSSASLSAERGGFSCRYDTSNSHNGLPGLRDFFSLEQTTPSQEFRKIKAGNKNSE